MIAKNNKSKDFRLPILQGVLPIKGLRFRRDLCRHHAGRAGGARSDGIYKICRHTGDHRSLYHLDPDGAVCDFRILSAPGGWSRFGDGGHPFRRTDRYRVHGYR